jgi:hypothetical protein
MMEVVQSIWVKQLGVENATRHDRAMLSPRLTASLASDMIAAHAQ